MYEHIDTYIDKDTQIHTHTCTTHTHTYAHMTKTKLMPPLFLLSNHQNVWWSFTTRATLGLWPLPKIFEGINSTQFSTCLAITLYRLSQHTRIKHSSLVHNYWLQRSDHNTSRERKTLKRCFSQWEAIQIHAARCTSPLSLLLSREIMIKKII